MATDLPVCLVDFETRSYLNVKHVGAWRYAEDSTTEIMCMGWKFIGTDRRGLWVPGITEFPQEILDHIEAGGIFEAHNVQFERAIWIHILNRRLGLPVPKRWKDTLAACAYRGIPLGLDDAGRALDLPIQKDKRGKYLLQTLCMPKWGTKNDPDRIYREDWDLMQELYDYCDKDIDSEECLGQTIGELSDAEYGFWILDQKINQRGVQLDVEAVQSSLEVIGIVEEKLNNELKDITDNAVERASQRDRLVNWIRSKGFSIEDLTKDRIEDLLDRDEKGQLDHVDPKVIRALEIRAQLAKASTKKLEKMMQTVSMDGRIRGLLQYHGAGTGRWAGRLVQPQNFPRPFIKEDMEVLVDMIKRRDAETLEYLYGGAMNAISSSLRGMFIAKPEHVMHVCDFSAIEARVTFWVADCLTGLEVFHRSDRKESEDIYCVTASDLVGFEVKKAEHGNERQLGKITVLGCFEADTEVLTNRGWVPIIDVRPFDKLWDGLEWVTHDGPIYQGQKETINLLGVSVTPEHEIWTGEKWEPAVEVMRHENIRSQALEHSLENLPWWVLHTIPQVDLNTFKFNVRAALQSTPSGSTTFSKVKAPAATHALKSNLGIGVKNILDTLTSFQRNITGFGFSTASPLAFSVATTHPIRHTPTMEDEESSFMSLGERTADCSSNTSSPLKDGTSPALSWIEKMLIKVTNQETYGLPLALKIWQTNVKSLSSKTESQNLKNVYDIVNVGPRNRFTILTDKGPLIVSNCGYQMGWSKLQFQAEKDYNTIVSDEQAQQMVSVYRTKYKEVPWLWYGLQEAAIETVRTGKPHRYRKIVYELVDDQAGRWLACVLPNGRRLWYYQPVVQKMLMPWDKWQDTLSYMGRDNKKGGSWGRVTTYGGMLTENVVQAIARDLMAEAMVRVEDEGFPIILTIHDEIIAERFKTEDYLDQQKYFEDLMSVCPPWANGCPIAVEGGAITRYQKVG